LFSATHEGQLHPVDQQLQGCVVERMQGCGEFRGELCGTREIKVGCRGCWWCVLQETTMLVGREMAIRIELAPAA
jgi:hypothetical protein